MEIWVDYEDYKIKKMDADSLMEKSMLIFSS